MDTVRRRETQAYSSCAVLLPHKSIMLYVYSNSCLVRAHAWIWAVEISKAFEIVDPFRCSNPFFVYSPNRFTFYFQHMAWHLRK